MIRLLISLFLAALLVSSCKKNIDDNNGCIDLTRPTDPVATTEFVPCNCTVNSEGGPSEYIRAQVNGITLCADLVSGYGGYPFGNMLKYGKIIRGTDSTYYDNLYMIRHTKDQRFELAIFLENTHTLTKQYPYLLPRANPEPCEIGELQLINMADQAGTACFPCTTNVSNYYSQFIANGLTLRADKFENGYFEGRFEGTTRTGLGRTAVVTNGAFRIRLTLLPGNIIVP
jgi:hypothetical protein